MIDISIEPDDLWLFSGSMISFALCIFVLLGLLLKLRDTKSHRMFVWAMIGFFTINAADHLAELIYNPFIWGPAWLFQWHEIFLPCFMIALYFFVRGLTSAAPKLIRRDWLHFIPIALSFLCLSPALLLPGEIRRDPEAHGLSQDHLDLIQLGDDAFWALWVVTVLIYGTLCARKLIQHKRNIRDVFSDLTGKTLAWLDALVATILILSLIVIVDEVLALMNYPEIRLGPTEFLFDLVLVFSFGLFALRAVPPLPGWTGAVLEPPVIETSTPAPPSPKPDRYARSGLTPEDLNRYADRLTQRMEVGQLWRNHALSLRALASEISIPSIHLSEVLNTKLGMSFYDYVNQCRIRDACELLATTSHTILEISETVGFNSKSTFNTSFKKVTEQTPSQWRAKHARK